MTDPDHLNRPLAERMRPLSLDEFVGQEHLVGKGHMLRQLLSQGRLPSLLLWGPPGSGKTTLATILARAVTAEFVHFSAVLSGVKEVRQIVAQARERQQQGRATLLFVDEIHRFNKSQQDGFLPHVESGLLTLIGATTENPSFQVIAPLLSRCQVLVLKPLAAEAILPVLERALRDKDKGLGNKGLKMEAAVMEQLARLADGDCRRALNTLETAASLALARKSADQPAVITGDDVLEALQHRTLRYDTGGEEHYNLISALHKSLRDSDPDGAGYWLERMLVAGEDPLYISRRLIRFASEDIGNSDPRALDVALNAHQTYHLLGTPEGELALLQAVFYLATAPKSNAVYQAEKKIRRDIKKSGSLAVPLHLRNAPTRLMKELGYGRDYRYAHDQPDGLVLQEHLPRELAGRRYYEPSERGYEQVIRNRLIRWRQILRERQRQSQSGAAS